MLTVLEALPEGLLNRETHQLHELLPQPTLIHLRGKREPALFVSILLHGNEDTGWRAVRELLRAYQGKLLPRALSLFIGNVSAARINVRHLDQQPDYNRIWRPGTTPEQQMTQQVVQIMRTRGVFASIDIHNNTGLNPHYTCVSRLDDASLHLATLFSRTVVYLPEPDTLQSAVFAEFCPSVVLECGKTGSDYGVEKAFVYLEACLHLSDLPKRPVPAHDLNLFHTAAVIKIPPDVTFGFGDKTKDICFRPDLDQLNFQELPAHTPLAQICPGSLAKLEIRNHTGKNLYDRYCVLEKDTLYTIIPLMPAMLTLNTQVIRQDCLGYLMERYVSPHQ